MRDWNVVVVLRGQMSRAIALLRRLGLGPVTRSRFLDVLVMKVGDPRALLESLDEKVRKTPGRLLFLSRIIPCDHSFSFNSPEEFEAKARIAIAGYAQPLAGKSFHVRVHRRGFKGRLESNVEERRLGSFLYDRLESAGTPARVTFKDPDAVVFIETVGNQGGTALLPREELQRFQLLPHD